MARLNEASHIISIIYTHRVYIYIYIYIYTIEGTLKKSQKRGVCSSRHRRHIYFMEPTYAKNGDFIETHSWRSGKEHSGKERNLLNMDAV